MVREFTGKSEQEAINKAIEELHIEREDFDVEVIDNGRRGLFKKTDVKIRVHVDTGEEEVKENKVNVIDAFSDFKDDDENALDDADEDDGKTYEIDENLEAKVCEFLTELGKHMGYSSKVSVESRNGKKILFSISSDDSSYVIGKKGRTLDSLQVLANVYASKFNSDRKIVLDSEGYKVRHDEKIIHNAYKTAQLVKKTGRSKLLPPMNPYERRLVHSALGDVTGIETKSEGDGLIKQVRVSLKPGFKTKYRHKRYY